ncbi:Cof-type HAD-IIB family hydrolase [Companilactobacillus farciminis]|nr:Cof-type HAD-IIB family hydrolase [Companilactobacillus farciminis]
MSEIKLILSDIDGTILNDENVIDSGLKAAIGKLHQKNIPFVLASARSPEGMRQIASDLDVLDNPIACYNGALVVKDLQNKNYTTIFSHELNVAEVEKMFTILDQRFPEISINLYSGSDWYVNDLDKWVQIEADITKMNPIVKKLPALITEHTVPIHKLLLIGETKQIQKALNYFKQLGFSNSSFYLSKPNYLEITNSNVSKEKALRELAKNYQLDLKNTMTLGDNFNDVPMLKIAGLGVAMQNAPSEVQKCANVVTETNNQNGVSKAIEKYAL